MPETDCPGAADLRAPVVPNSLAVPLLLVWVVCTLLSDLRFGKPGQGSQASVVRDAALVATFILELLLKTKGGKKNGASDVMVGGWRNFMYAFAGWC